MTICPTITAYDADEYKRQVHNVAGFAGRIHIDLMDGELAPTKSPELSSIWWPEHVRADVHLMYKRPSDYLDSLISLKPNMVIIHFEAEGDHVSLAQSLRASEIKVGLALLQPTSVEEAKTILEHFNHVLIFSGNLGHHGGTADLSLTSKVEAIRQLYPAMEIAWDGGINDQNIQELVSRGVSVLNVGGYIQDAESPQEAYQSLQKQLGLF